MYKIWLKTCSIILVLTLIVNMLPMAVFGQAYRDVISSTEQVEKVETVETENARIVKEITENRTEFSKEFQLSNGLRMAAVYADAVHYETENGWEEIDNTLVAKADDTYTNTAGVWDVRFPDQLTKTKGITIEKDGYTLSFFMAGEINSDHAIMSAPEPVVAETKPLLVEMIPETVPETTAETVPETTAETVPETTAETVVETVAETTAETVETTVETVSETISETVTETTPDTTTETVVETVPEITATTEATLPILELTPEMSAEKLTLSEVRLSQASIEKVDYSEMKASAKHPEIVPEKAHSRLSYSNVFQNTQIIYDLDSNKVKESIVLSAYSQTLRGYRYTLHTGEMIPVLEESGQILFYDKAKENIVMVMPAPYLVDNADVYSYDISISLTGGSGTYTLTYTLPQQWLADQDRSWPVILDPVVQADLDANNILDRSVAQNKTYEQDWGMNSCGYDTDTGIVRFYLKYNTLPAITSSDVVVGATIQMYQGDIATTTTPVEVHKVNANWTPGGITWNSQPAYNTNIEDYALVNAIKWYGWVVTDIVRDWYANNNYGMLFKADSNIEGGGTPSYKQFLSSDYGTANSRPVLTITFRNANGLESYWDYTTSSAGRAGTGYVNNYTGNLVWTRTDMGFGGNLMPVTITSVYNANDAMQPNDNNNANNSAGNAFGMGYGWRTNYNQLVYQWSLDGTYYVWEDSDGTDHYFKYSSASTYKDEDGLELTLKTNGSGTTKYSITDKNGNVSYFDTYGRLSEIRNNQATKKYITIEYSGSSNRIEKITDGAGRIYDFVYSGTSLQSIRYLGGNNTVHSTVTYQYTSSNLTKVTFPDNKTVNYTYSNKMLQTAKDVDNYTLTYSYHSISDNSWQPYRVASVTEVHNNANGGKLNFTYGHNQTTVTDHNGNVEILQFNDFGNTVCIQDDEGRAQFAQFTKTKADDTGKGNQLKVASKLQNTVSNYLLNNSFESSVDWHANHSAVTVSQSTQARYLGYYSLKLESTATSLYGAYSPVFFAKPGETITFSAYVKNPDGQAFLALHHNDDVNFYTYPGETLEASNTWVRSEVSFTNTTGSNLMMCAYLFVNSPGTYYMDCVQVESSSTASRFNLVDNGDFATTGATQASWTRGSTLTSADKVISATAAADPLNANVYSITGSPTSTKCLTHVINILGQPGDSFVFSGWAKGNSAPLESYDSRNREFAIRARFWYSGVEESDFYTIRFNPDSNAWQYVSGAMVAEKIYNCIELQLVYNYNVNTVYFDGIQLYKEQFGNSYTYDSNGNVTSVKDLQNKTTTYEYVNNNLTRELINGVAQMTYTYDSYHNVKTATTREGLVYSFTYDTYGNNTSVSIGSGDNTITASATYSDNGNYLVSTTDTQRQVTTYGYDPNTNVLKWVQYPQDTASTRTNYTYDSMYRTASAATTTDTGLAMSAQYTYTNDQIGSIQTPSTKYNFTYGNFGQRTAVKVGTQTLASYTYTNDRNRYLNRLDYGNGDNVQYTYDDKGRVTKETFEDGDTVTYSYDNNGALAKVKDSATGITTTYRYDLTDRLVNYTETGTNYNHSVSYTYDNRNNLTKLTENVNGTTYITTYTYDDDNRVVSKVTNNLGVYYSYDTLGRLTQQITKDGSITYTTETYSYYGNSTQVASHAVTVNGTTATTAYAYDVNGNIICEEAPNGICTEYFYDSANQLLGEHNGNESYAWNWTYDDAGNIVNRKEYDYRDSVVGPELMSWDYTYGDSQWGDLLTNFRGNDFSYDQIGNLTNDGYWSYTWEHGRELASMTQNGTTWNYTYDAGGMRTKRTNGTDIYTYVYNGSQLTHMTKGNDTLYFIYDAEGTPVSVKYNGVLYNYVTNLQGDVTAILTWSGQKVVSYTYDAWGKQLSCTGSMSSTLGKLNPLRYRGYVYDQETRLYYLQSRYYNPEWGRFINADAFVATGQGFVGNNMFAYCNNNPVNYKDPNGREFLLATAGGVAIAALVVCVVVASYCAAKTLCEILSYATTISQTALAQISFTTEELEPPDVTYPGDDSSKAPGDDYEWKGQEPVGGDKGSWVNNKTGEQMHPDLNHDPSVAPHYDYTNGVKPKVWWRVFRDGRIELRK